MSTSELLHRLYDLCMFVQEAADAYKAAQR
jgi:hypothetical protein